MRVPVLLSFPPQSGRLVDERRWSRAGFVVDQHKITATTRTIVSVIVTGGSRRATRRSNTHSEGKLWNLKAEPSHTQYKILAVDVEDLPSRTF